MFIAKDEKDACYEILSFGLWRNLVIYNIRLLLAKKLLLKLFWRAIYSTIKGRIACWIKYCFEDYVEVKEKNIEIYEEINEDIIIEEDHEIKINVEEINEDPSINKDLEVEIVETIKEEIIEEVVNDLDEIKLDDCNIQTLIILVGDTKTKFIDFIGVERFDLTIDS